MNLYESYICMDLQDSEQRSLQNPAEKILQICTDSQRSKTWVSAFKKQKKICSKRQSRRFYKIRKLNPNLTFIDSCVAS